MDECHINKQLLKCSKTSKTSNDPSMKLLIDYREKKFVDLKNEKNNVDVQNLDLGDFQFVTVDNEIKMILERKNISDLASSIKDGRYLEQKNRLLSFRSNHPDVKIAYLLEGHYSFSPQFSCSNMNNKTLSGSIINSMIRDDIQIWFLKDDEETQSLLVNLHQRFTQNASKYFKTKEEGGMINHNYAPVAASSFFGAHAKKKDNMNENLCLIIQLSCIPGLSSKKAQDIIDTLSVKSIFGLCILLKDEEIHNNQVVDKKSKRDILKTVPGIGPKLVATIKQFLLVE